MEEALVTDDETESLGVEKREAISDAISEERVDGTVIRDDI